MSTSEYGNNNQAEINKWRWTDPTTGCQSDIENTANSSSLQSNNTLQPSFLSTGLTKTIDIIYGNTTSENEKKERGTPDLTLLQTTQDAELRESLSSTQRESSQTQYYDQQSSVKSILVEEPSSSNSEVSESTQSQQQLNNTQHRIKVNDKTELYKILIKEAEGKSILTIQQHHGFLTPNARNRLSRFIIRKELDNILKISSKQKLRTLEISNAQFMRLAKEITETFPGEQESTYFEPFMVINGKHINASGKLWYHFNYRKATLRKDDILQKSKKSDTVVSTVSEDTIDKLNVLKTLVDPWIKVTTLWCKTFEARRIYLMNNKTEVETYLKSHACLRVDKALELFESDFNRLYPENSSLLLTNWPKTRNFLIKKLSTLKITNVEDKGFISLLPTLSLEIQDTILLYLLPYLIPAERGKKRKSKGIENTNPAEKNYKRSFEERRNSFLIHLESAGTLETILNLTTLKVGNILMQQPVPVIVGPILGNTASYIILNNRVYTVSNTGSCLRAIDLALKICFAIDCEYPSNAYSLWLFLQQSYYQIINRGDIVPIALRAIIGEICEVVNTQ